MKLEKVSVPLAIIVAGGLIAGALYYSNLKIGKEKLAVQNTPPTITAGNMRKITSEDHIIGDPNAPVLIVEYSDTECPFCKTFHTTLKQVMSEYGAKGKVAWVYRHFPISQLHPKAPKEAEALECANELGGAGKFWQYTDLIYATTNSNNSLDDGAYNLPKIIPTDQNGRPRYTEKKPKSTTDAGQLSQIAASVGLDVKAFEQCLASGKYKDKVQADYDDAVKAGGRGTPTSVLITKDGTKTLIQGAQPYASIKATIDAALE